MRPDRSCLRLAMVIAGLAMPGAALAQSATCQGLRDELASLTRIDETRANVYLGAAQRQVAEMQRMAAYGRAIGCDRTRFLIFGSDPPPQCAGLNARFARMQANLARLQEQARALGDASSIAARRRQTQEAIRQYCDSPAPVEATIDPAQQPYADDTPPDDQPDGAPPDATPQDAGTQTELPPGKPVCVRMCDGYFFPLASAGDLGPEGAPQMCQAQCPGAETQAFSIREGEDISQAVGPGGESYMETSNALRYQKARVPGCSCRKSGESWGQALRGAQDMLGTDGSEIIVDADKAERMSRPPAPASVPARPRKPRIAGGDAASPARGEAVPAPAPSGAPLARGPDGKRDVRVIAPAAASGP